MKKIFLLIIVVILLVVGGYFAFFAESSLDKNKSESNEKKVSLFEKLKSSYTLTSLKDTKMSFKKEGDSLISPNNRPYLLVFITSQCPNCLGQAQHLANLERDFKDKVDIFGIFVDKSEDFSVLNVFVNDSKTNFEWFNSGDIAEFSRLYDIRTLPLMALYDKSGNLVMTYSGITPEEMIAFDINRMLGK